MSLLALPLDVFAQSSGQGRGGSTSPSGGASAPACASVNSVFRAEPLSVFEALRDEQFMAEAAQKIVQIPDLNGQPVRFTLKDILEGYGGQIRILQGSAAEMGTSRELGLERVLDIRLINDVLGPMAIRFFNLFASSDSSDFSSIRITPPPSEMAPIEQYRRGNARGTRIGFSVRHHDNPIFDRGSLPWVVGVMASSAGLKPFRMSASVYSLFLELRPQNRVGAGIADFSDPRQIRDRWMTRSHLLMIIFSDLVLSKPTLSAERLPSLIQTFGSMVRVMAAHSNEFGSLSPIQLAQIQDAVRARVMALDAAAAAMRDGTDSRYHQGRISNFSGQFQAGSVGAEVSGYQYSDAQLSAVFARTFVRLWVLNYFWERLNPDTHLNPRLVTANQREQIMALAIPLELVRDLRQRPLVNSQALDRLIRSIAENMRHASIQTSR